MKKDRILLIKILFIIMLFSQNNAFADDFLLPDWNYYQNDKNSKITENANFIEFKQIRNNHTFRNHFDEQNIKIYKNPKISNLGILGENYLNRAMMGDNKSSKYIIKNSDNEFEGAYCSAKKQKCEIIRYLYGYKGIIEIKYVHNNLWHFQNNIGSFIETQNRIQNYPEFFINLITPEIYTRI